LPDKPEINETQTRHLAGILSPLKTKVDSITDGEFDVPMQRAIAYSTWNTYNIALFNAASNTDQAWFSKYYETWRTALTNPTLVIIYSFTVADNWNVLVRCTAETSLEGANNNTLVNATTAWDASGGGLAVTTLHFKEIALTGTISPVDLVGIRIVKSSVDAQDLYINGCFIKP
jgi:hypothetical protein